MKISGNEYNYAVNSVRKCCGVCLQLPKRCSRCPPRRSHRARCRTLNFDPEARKKHHPNGLTCEYQHKSTRMDMHLHKKYPNAHTYVRKHTSEQKCIQTAHACMHSTSNEYLLCSWNPHPVRCTCDNGSSRIQIRGTNEGLWVRRQVQVDPVNLPTLDVDDNVLGVGSLPALKTKTKT